MEGERRVQEVATAEEEEEEEEEAAMKMNRQSELSAVRNWVSMILSYESVFDASSRFPPPTHHRTPCAL